jgi:hypothetical protein
MHGILLEAVLRALGDHEVHEATVAEIKVFNFHIDCESISDVLLKILCSIYEGISPSDEDFSIVYNAVNQESQTRGPPNTFVRPVTCGPPMNFV